MLITRILFFNFLPETLCLKCALAREWCPSATLEGSGRAEASVTFNLIVIRLIINNNRLRLI